MTAHPNVQLLANAYQAVEHGDLQPMLSLLNDDVTWTDSTLGPLAGTYGKDEVPRFFGKMMDVYGGTLRFEVAGMVVGDDHGIVLTRESGIVNGQAVNWAGVHVYTFGNGRVTSFVSYASAEYQAFWAGRHADAGS